MRITEQYFNANFNAHQNDFTLNNGNYEATFTRGALDMVHDDVNDGEYKNLRIQSRLECSNRIFRIDSELYPRYTPDATYCTQ